LEQLNTIDTTDVTPLSHPIAGHTISLEDVVPVDCDDPEAYLSNIKHRMINNAVKIKSMLA
jgi:Asp-tRNA(Asn)/Glu-tRNA(Gln) amidotransferase C subunit